MTSTANATVTFRLEENYEFLQLDKLTGQLWFKWDSWKKQSLNPINLVVSAEKSDGFMARMTLDLHVIVVKDMNEFCENFMCFYESVKFYTIEDYNDNFKPHEIGETSPKFFTRLCKNFDVEYELLNCKSIKKSRE